MIAKLHRRSDCSPANEDGYGYLKLWPYPTSDAVLDEVHTPHNSEVKSETFLVISFSNVVSPNLLTSHLLHGSHVDIKR